VSIDPLSLILLPTLACNAACDYCFENKSTSRLTLDRLCLLLDRVCDYLDEQGIGELAIHWQGGEVMLLPPEWYEQADERICRIAATRRKEIRNYVQSNLIGYDERWYPVIKRMFDNSIGTSMDFPNLYRRLPGKDPSHYDRLITHKIGQAQQAGIHLGVIAVPNDQTLKIGARRFYDHFVGDLQIVDFQVNTPFPGGMISLSKQTYPLNNSALTRFLIELIDIWIATGYDQGVKIGPFDRLIDYFIDGDPGLVCIWRDNCANEFFCIDPKGNVAQCDCWVASYPQFHFGNLLENESLSDLLANSAARRQFLERPASLMQQEDCLNCTYLSLCHGGCPVRAYTVEKDLRRKDPYCETYQAVFKHMEQIAADLAKRRSLA
jgi:uncharacterized protein